MGFIPVPTDPARKRKRHRRGKRRSKQRIQNARPVPVAASTILAIRQRLAQLATSPPQRPVV